MWEAYELENEDLLWSGMAFHGGIGGQRQAPCGAISASAVCLGQRHSCSLADKQRTKQARLDVSQDASELVRSFDEKFGTLICNELLGIDLSDPEARRQFKESGMWEEKCGNYVKFVIEKLYELY